MSQDRATVWSVTINNPTQEDEDQIHVARMKGWTVIGQRERGENGTEHYQLMVRTPQVRFSAVKKQFSRAHIEVGRNPVALSAYVQKEETKVGELVAPSDKYPSLNKYWDMIYKKFDTGDKDGWDWSSDDIQFYSETEQVLLDSDPLAWLDSVSGGFIKEGYFVEHHVVNPAVRSQWKRFYSQILFRSKAKLLAFENKKDNMPETDRQTDSVQIQQITIPTLNITNADDHTWEESRLPRVSRYENKDNEGDQESESSSSFCTHSSISDSDSETSDRS